MYAFCIAMLFVLLFWGWILYNIHTAKQSRATTNRQTIPNNAYDVQNLAPNLPVEQKDFLCKVSQELHKRYITEDDIKEFTILNITKDFAEIPDWDIWNYPTHKAPGQYEKLGEAIQSKSTMRIVDVDKDNGEIYVNDKNDNTTYITSADGCQCRDFITNDLPCKHMYFAVLYHEDFSIDNNASNISIVTPNQRNNYIRVINSSNQVTRQQNRGSYNNQVQTISRQQETQIINDIIIDDTILNNIIARFNAIPNWKRYHKITHSTEEQIIRMKRAMYGGAMRILDFDATTGTAFVHGQSYQDYQVDAHGCSCKDFQRRNQPCKHMYFVAIYAPLDLPSIPLQFSEY